MYCIKCGHEIKNDEKYCPNCGYKIDSFESNKNVNEKEISMPENKTFNESNGLASSSSKIRTKLVAALLAFFLGSFGVHNFYLERSSYGFSQLGLSICKIIISGIFGVLLATNIIDVYNYQIIQIFITLIGAIPAIWGFIDFILILMDKLIPGKNIIIKKQ